MPQMHLWRGISTLPSPRASEPTHPWPLPREMGVPAQAEDVGGGSCRWVASPRQSFAPRCSGQHADCGIEGLLVVPRYLDKPRYLDRGASFGDSGRFADPGFDALARDHHSVTVWTHS